MLSILTHRIMKLIADKWTSKDRRVFTKCVVFSPFHISPLHSVPFISATNTESLPSSDRSSVGAYAHHHQHHSVAVFVPYLFILRLVLLLIILCLFLQYLLSSLALLHGKALLCSSLLKLRATVDLCNSTGSVYSKTVCRVHSFWLYVFLYCCIHSSYGMFIVYYGIH